MNIMIIYD